MSNWHVIGMAQMCVRHWTGFLDFPGPAVVLSPTLVWQGFPFRPCGSSGRATHRPPLLIKWGRWRWRWWRWWSFPSPTVHGA